MATKKYALWILMMLPLLILVVVALAATGFYRQYLNRVSSSWDQFPLVELSEITPIQIDNVLKPRLSEAKLSDQQQASLAESLYHWIESQRTPSIEAFLTFRYHGLQRKDLSVSESLSHYYSQFLPPEHAQAPTESIIESLYRARNEQGELTFHEKRLCLSCVQALSLTSIQAHIRERKENPLNEFMNLDNPLSLEGFTGVYEAVGPFRHLLSELTYRSKTVNVSFILRSGMGARNAYKCGIQWVWLPQRNTWFPIELTIGYPGDRMPMEAFLF